MNISNWNENLSISIIGLINNILVTIFFIGGKSEMFDEFESFHLLLFVWFHSHSSHFVALSDFIDLNYNLTIVLLFQLKRFLHVSIKNGISGCHLNSWVGPFGDLIIVILGGKDDALHLFTINGINIWNSC